MNRSRWEKYDLESWTVEFPWCSVILTDHSRFDQWNPNGCAAWTIVWTEERTARFMNQWFVNQSNETQSKWKGSRESMVWEWFAWHPAAPNHRRHGHAPKFLRSMKLVGFLLCFSISRTKLNVCCSNCCQQRDYLRRTKEGHQYVSLLPTWYKQDDKHRSASSLI